MSGVASAIHRPGFLQVEDLARWMAHASGFVHPSLMEPWGLVANEAAACELPLLISDRAGCAETLVTDPAGTTGRRFEPTSLDEMTTALTWLAGLPEPDRQAMGRRAAEVVSQWGPERFARGMIEALSLAFDHERRKARRKSQTETRLVSAR
jgi:glycosyltransferase involved in cell wall biosynthesis